MAWATVSVGELPARLVDEVAAGEVTGVPGQRGTPSMRWTDLWRLAGTQVPPLLRHPIADDAP